MQSGKAYPIPHFRCLAAGGPDEMTSFKFMHDPHCTSEDERCSCICFLAFAPSDHLANSPTQQRWLLGVRLINKAIYCINSHCTWSFGWPQLWPQVQSIPYILRQKVFVHNRLNLALKFVSRANCNFCRTSFKTNEWATTWCLWQEHVLFSHVGAATRHFLLIVVPHLADC